MKKITLLFIFSLIINLLMAQVEIPSTEFIFKNLSEEKFISAPAISFDGNYLIFLVKNDESYKFFESTDSNGVWSEPKELEDITNFMGESVYKNAAVYNYDASKIYFEAMNNTNTDIFVTNRTTNGWTEPEQLSNNINTFENEGEPSISADDNILYFVRFENDKNEECGKIYSSKKNQSFEWTKAVPLIEPLNIECERAPRILSDNKTLIFSSIRGKDKDFRLYYTKNLFSDIWVIPIPIGEFAKDNNLYPAIDQNARKIIFASLKKDKKSQLFIADFPSKFKPEETFIISGKITDINNIAIPGTISLLDPVSTVSLGRYENNPQTGEYLIYVPKKSKYVLDFTAENYSHQFINYNNFKKTNTTTETDIQLYSETSLYLNVFDKDIYEAFDVEIKVVDTENNQDIAIESQKLDKGKFLLTLPIGKKYSINLTSDFSEPYNLEIDLTGNIIFNTFEKNVEITSHKAKYTFKIIDSQDKTGVECDIILVNRSTLKRVVSKAQTDENGEVSIFVREGDVYDITINPHGYAFYDATFEITDNQDIQQTVELQPLRQDVKIELKNITFETNSAELNIESYQELDNVVRLMQDNPEIKIEISAHTDNVGSDIYNQKLSEKRAKSVVNYLIQHDVNNSKLVSNGYGETQPLVANDTDENKAKNRRVELKIIEVN